MGFENLEIQLTLGTPVLVSTPWINSDGYIAYDCAFSQNPNLLNEIHGQHNWDFFDDLEIPLEKTSINSKEFFYHSSILRFEPLRISKKDMYRHTDLPFLDHTKNPQKKYMVVGGEFKGNKKEFIAISSPKAIFWCRGDRVLIDRILSRLNGIGKNTRAGNGQIISYSIKPIEKDYSVFHPTFGLNRPIPISYGKKLDNEIALISYKPPYWARSNHSQCYIPGGV